MAEELGRIEKPEASKFANKRKLYLVPLIFAWQDAPLDYTLLMDIYWNQVKEQLANLESKIGAAKRIYHESVSAAGEEALKILEQAKSPSHNIISEKCQSGAQIEATEDEELVAEFMDWERHIMMGFISEKVARQVSQSFKEVSQKRYEHIARRINETFNENEVGILFISEGHGVQFPTDIEVFSVFPPSLDEIHRWLRNYSEKAEKDTK